MGLDNSIKSTMTKGKDKMLVCKKAKDTITGVEMDCGDVFECKLRNGEARKMILKDTGYKLARIFHESS